MPWLYKICDAALLHELQSTGRCAGSLDDLRDGFVHCSLAEQLRATFDKYFAALHAAGAPLWVLQIDPEALADGALQLEASRDAQLFPHIYDALQWHSVRAMHTIAEAKTLGLL
jgi:uncharacterized protein (DUF952 family)